jgi:hypothetical protein
VGDSRINLYLLESRRTPTLRGGVQRSQAVGGRQDSLGEANVNFYQLAIVMSINMTFSIWHSSIAATFLAITLALAPSAFAKPARAAKPGK